MTDTCQRCHQREASETVVIFVGGVMAEKADVCPPCAEVA